MVSVKGSGCPPLAPRAVASGAGYPRLAPGADASRAEPSGPVRDFLGSPCPADSGLWDGAYGARSSLGSSWSWSSASSSNNMPPTSMMMPTASTIPMSSLSIWITRGDDDGGD